MTSAIPTSGLFEHWHGVTDLQAALRYWHQLGFGVVKEGTLTAEQSNKLYGHASALKSVRLQHLSGDEQGFIRLMVWEQSSGSGLGFEPALVLGSRWSGFYTTDILRIRDAYLDDVDAISASWQVTDLARLFIDESQPSFLEPFVGLRETTVFGPEQRHAFLQRVGFDRPGFGSFTKEAPLPSSAATHGNLVIPGPPSSSFYEEALGLTIQTESMYLDWTNETVRRSLSLREGQGFDVIVYMAGDHPSGFLRVYTPDFESRDCRSRSRPGELGVCCFSYRYPPGAIEEKMNDLKESDARTVGALLRNEFGERSLSLLSPDGSFWNLVEQNDP